MTDAATDLDVTDGAAMDRADLIVIGAGPAGMAAAGSAAAQGLRVVLLDEQAGPGGQVFRAVTAAGAGRGAILGADYLHGAALAEGLRAPGVRHLPGAVVWDIEAAGPGFVATFSRAGCAAQIEADALILAIGALERPVPIPGWTLPGVMTAGAGQILLKSSGLVAERAILAGAGPLLYLLAAQMVRAGVPPLALVETCGRADMIRALPRLAAGLRGWRVVLKGLGLLAELGRAGVRRITGATDLRIEGGGRAEALAFRVGGGERRIACDTVLLHQGVVANTQASRLLRLEHDWHEGQRALVPRCDGWGETAQRGIFIAGDGAGIAGAQAAEAAGRLAALQAACRLGRITRETRDRLAAAPRRSLAAERAIRPFLEAAFPVPAAILRPDDATIICRCEEVTAGQVRGWARLGCTGANQLKAFGRAGMGPCQGRFCAQTVVELLAEAQGCPPGRIAPFRIRPPLKPVTLGELAALDGAGVSVSGVAVPPGADRHGAGDGRSPEE